LSKRVISAQQEPNLFFDIVLDASNLDSIVNLEKGIRRSRVAVKGLARRACIHAVNLASGRTNGT
jgi:hypothetical protein